MSRLVLVRSIDVLMLIVINSSIFCFLILDELKELNLFPKKSRIGCLFPT